MKAWIRALRLRTLPLAVSGIIVGNALAYHYGKFDELIFKLSLYTAVLLQILSNLANDYGDFKKGTDNEKRIGPERALQSGAIREADMKMAMFIAGFFAFISGLILVYYGTKDLQWQHGMIFLVIGVFALIAAVLYTVGRHAYGYKGLGDLLVFIFFGIIAVAGSFYLQFKSLKPEVFLPACAIGFFSAAVLNMNNMRDIVNDGHSGKMTIPVRIGQRRAKLYHLLLLASGISCAAALMGFVEIRKWYALIPLLIFVLNGIFVIRITNEKLFDKQLKLVVFGTLIYSAVLSYALINK